MVYLLKMGGSFHGKLLIITRWDIDSLTWWSHQYTSTIASSNHNYVSCAGVISATFQASLCQFNLGGKCPWLSPNLRRSGGNNSCLKCLGHCGSSCLYRSPSVNQEKLSSKRLNRMVLHQFLIMVYTCYILLPA